MTRPKRHLAVIGDSSTLSKGSKYLEVSRQPTPQSATLPAET